ncbi:MAG: FMN-binding protein [Planctomycetota bacterium]|jgi:Na+-translocating ferredoxin:NAD+ oxidoreductase RnfG subunit
MHEPKHPIKIGKDIDAITAATLSSQAMADGIGDIVKMLKTQTKQAQP